MFDDMFAGKNTSWLVVPVTAAPMQIGQFPVCDPHCTMGFWKAKSILERHCQARVLVL